MSERRKAASGQGYVRVHRRDAQGNPVQYRARALVDGRMVYAYGRTEREAIRKLQARQVAAREGRLLDPSTTTVGRQWDEWLDHKRHSLEPKSIAGYEDIRKYYLPDWLLRIRLVKLTSRDVKAWITELAGRGLSPRTIYLSHTSLKAAVQEAVDAEPPLIHRNPLSSVKPPKQRLVRPRKWLRPAEAGRLQRALGGDDHPLAALFLLQLNTGARPGELAGLTWDNVLWSQRKIMIRQRLVEIATKPVGLLPLTKTGERGVRTVTVSAACLAKLEEHRTQQEAQRLAYCEGMGKVVPVWNPLGLVFCSEVGTPYNQGNLRRALREVLKRAGLTQATITPYGLRHTAATSMGAAGLHPKQAAERLGHTPEEYLRTYSHALAELDAEAADRLDAYLEAQGIDPKNDPDGVQDGVQTPKRPRRRSDSGRSQSGTAGRGERI
jgi:integrase